MNPYNLQESYYEMYEEKYEPDPFGRPGGKYGGVPKPGSGYDRAWTANLKALEKLEKKNQKESVDLYDLILSHLIDDGYADSYEDANTMMAHMSEEWYNDIVETFLEEGFVDLTPEKQKRVERHIGRLSSKALEQNTKLQGNIEKYKKRKANPVTKFLLGTRGPQQEVAKDAKELKKTKGHLETSMDAIRRSQAGRMSSIQYKRNQVTQKLRELGVDPDAAKRAKSNIKPFKRGTQNESYYAYDLIVLRLLDEGYAESYEQADSIIESMSGDWMIDILDEAKSDEGLSDDLKKKARRRRGGYDSDWDYDDSRRQAAHRLSRGTSRNPHPRYEKMPGTYSREANYLKTLSPEERDKRVALSKKLMKRGRR